MHILSALLLLASVSLYSISLFCNAVIKTNEQKNSNGKYLFIFKRYW